MFKKLKDKLAEEVKSSPSRIQQFAQAAQAAVSSASSTASDTVSGSENFFSITEEDKPQFIDDNKQPVIKTTANSQLNTLSNHSFAVPINNGNVPPYRSRKLSNSSMASDVSFRLPKYDLPAVYHLQSDMESASEFEDGGSVSNINLNLINKEQLHQAYKKSLDRYHKYRGRYAEIARRYRDLEIDNTKARSVLVETQDKALRRISELREQCLLEQQAKAHLESTLRLEMEEMECVIKTLTTKLSLKDIPQNFKENLIQLDNSNAKADADCLINFNNETPNGENHAVENQTEKIKQLEVLLSKYKDTINEEKSKLIVKTEELAVVNKKLEQFQMTVKKLTTREEENTILLAENKLMIHSELANKEQEFKALQQRMNSLEKDLKQRVNERDNLKQENGKFIEKIKELEEKNSRITEVEKLNINLESSIKELKAKIIIFETEKGNIMTKHDQDIQNFKQEYENMLRKNEKLEAITHNKMKENNEKLEIELKHVKSAHAEISKQANERQTYNKKLINEINTYKAKIDDLSAQTERIRAENLIANEEKSKLDMQMKLATDEKQQIIHDLELLRTQYSQLKNDNEILNQQVVLLKENIENIESTNKRSEAESLQHMQNSLTALEEKFAVTNAELNQQLNENKLMEVKLLSMVKEKDDLPAVTTLKSKIDSLKNEKRDLEKTLEKEIRDKSELKVQVTNILQEIGRLEEQLKEVRHSYAEIEQQKRELEEKTEMMQLRTADVKHKMDKDQSQKQQNKVKEMEQKMQKVLYEKSQLFEKFGLLEETNGHLQISLKTAEESLAKESDENQELKNHLAAMRIEYEVSKDEIDKLQDKLTQCLDENSRLFNAKELMDHDYRSLQDQCEEKDKEKLCVLDTNKSLETELSRANENNQALETEKHGLTETCEKMQAEIDKMQKENDGLKKSLDVVNKQNSALSSELALLNEQKTINEQEIQLKYAQLTKCNKSLVDQAVALQNEISECNNRNEINLSELKQFTDENNSLKSKLINFTEFESKLENLEQLKIENEYLNTSVKHMQLDLNKNEIENGKFGQEIVELKSKLYVFEAEVAKHSESFQQKDTEMELLKSVCQRAQTMNDDLQNELIQLRDQCNTFKLLNEELQTNKDVADNQLQSLSSSLSYTKQQNETFQNEITKQKLLNDALQKTNQLVTDQLSEVSLNLKATTDNLLKQEETVTNLYKDIDSNQMKINEFTQKLENQIKFQEELQTIQEDNQHLNQIITELKNQTLKDTDKAELDILKRQNETIKLELAEFQQTANSNILNLNHEIDELHENARAYMEKTQELEHIMQTNAELRKDIEMYKQSENGNTNLEELVNVKRERDETNEKLKKIIHEVQDVSNRNLFLEQKCENYLILEQSNERFKLQNDKLSRQLDDTLVSLQHTEGIEANTEFEYLKNIMFQYLTNNINANSITLVKVIAAVLKFSPQQTQVALERESHRKSLVGQFNSFL